MMVIRYNQFLTIPQILLQLILAYNSSSIADDEHLLNLI